MAIWSRFFGNAASSAAGFGIGAAVSPALRPITQEVANETWQRYPNRPLSAQDAAEAVVRDVMSAGDAANEASMSGFDGDRFATLEALAGQPPGGQQLLEMLNRGFISSADVTKGLRQSRMRPEWYESYTKLRDVLVPVSDLVRMAVREVFTPNLRKALDLDADYPAAMTARAAELGLSEKNAREYWAAHWDLPSATQMAEMQFRGELSTAELEQGLRALDYAPTWRPKLAKILRPIPSLSDMIRFAVREVYDPKKRKALGLDDEFPPAFATAAALHGFDEEYAKQHWAAHWRLPSAEQGYHMLWRGEIKPAELDDLLKALDYPTKWRDRLSNIAYHVPGRIDLRRMLAAGIIDRGAVKAGYVKLGYTVKDAETLTVFAEQQAASGPTVHQKWADKARQSLFTTTHAEYLDGSLDVAAVNTSLDIVNVPAAERPAIFAAWDREKSTTRVELTASQVKKAYKKAVMNDATGKAWTRDDAIEQLIAKGYTEADAHTFLDE